MKPDRSIMPEREPVMIPPRKSFTKAQRLRIFMAHGGVCGICNAKIFGSYEIEHRIPHAICGRDDDGNLYPAHPACHAPKTAEDKGAIAKLKRLAGETCTGPTKRPLQSRSFGPLTRKFSGLVSPKGRG